MSIRKMLFALVAVGVLGGAGVAATTTTASAQEWRGDRWGDRWDGPRRHGWHGDRGWHQRCWWTSERRRVWTPYGWRWERRNVRVCR